MTARPAKHALTFVFVTVLIDMVGFGIVIPVVPELIMELTGESLSQAAIYGGWLLFLCALMQFFTAPIIGNISDPPFPDGVWSSRRPLALFGRPRLESEHFQLLHDVQIRVERA